MKIMNRKYFVIITLVILIAESCIGLALFKNRSFSHLAVWNISESDKEQDFYWAPEDTPEYFRFETNSSDLKGIRQEALPLTTGKNSTLKSAVEVARYLKTKRLNSSYAGEFLKWDSPLGLLKQVEDGAKGANCFHYSIIFSTYLTSLNIKSRLWALEGDNFNNPHSVNEFYSPELRKWVFMDILQGFYVSERGKPLSLLELRKALLGGRSSQISVHWIADERVDSKTALLNYRMFLKYVFLRARNDFISKFKEKERYGFLKPLSGWLDKFPNRFRIGLGYILGAKDGFIHYVDDYSGSLRWRAVLAKSLLYFFICVLFYLIAVLLNLSRKDMRHR